LIGSLTTCRQYAHDLVYDLCRKAQIEDVPLVDLLDKHPEVKLERKELEPLCDPANYLGLSIEMTERVLNHHRMENEETESGH
jgi:3-carboxy-cis,cis-muconate cycloisomerase